LHFLSREIETAPAYVRGVDAVDYSPGALFKTSEDISLKSIHFKFSGVIFADNDSLYKVVGKVEGMYGSGADVYTHNLLVLHLGISARWRRFGTS
jgi:hypothetical protein